MHAVVCVCAVECPQAAIREGQAKLVRLQESIREQCDGIAQLQAEVRELDGQVAQQRAVSADLLAALERKDAELRRAVQRVSMALASLHGEWGHCSSPWGHGPCASYPPVPSAPPKWTSSGDNWKSSVAAPMCDRRVRRFRTGGPLWRRR